MHKLFCNGSDFSKKSLNRLVALAEKNNGRVKRSLIEKAFYFSRDSHKGQLRASNSPYFVHPLETAATLARMGLSSEVVAAGLLHDVLEDTGADKKTIRKKFGKEVFSLVQGMTKLRLIASESLGRDSLKNLQSLLLATTKDPRVILIKLADKLHNLRTLQFLPEKSRKRIASEALLIYVPIAHKIGLEELAVELEDLAFSFASPETFESIKSRLDSFCHSKEREIGLMVGVLRKRLEKASFCLTRRGVYSVFMKMRHTDRCLDELNDCVILNILVESEPDCYAALGTVHGIFPPLPNKVKDFIAAPKPSFYRVLQTTVFGPKEKPVKVRICTREMYAVNRQGVVAYRRIFGKRLSKEMEQSLLKLGLLLGKSSEKNGLLEALKTDFLTAPIYVFTSVGKLVELPKDSTVLDFAFATEKRWALHLLRAKVNGKKARIGKKLDFGQVVELFFSKKPRAKKRWLRYANSFLAREEIKKALKEKA